VKTPRPLIIFKAVTKNWIRSKSGLFFSVLFPVLLLLVFGAVFSGGGSSASRLFVQNLDTATNQTPTPLSKAFIEALNSTETFSISIVPTNETDPKTYARDTLGPLGGNIRILIISKGFQDNLLNGTLKVRVGITYNTTFTIYQLYEPYLNDTQKIAVQQGLAQINQYNANLTDSHASLTIVLDSSDQSSAIIKNIIVNIANAFNYQLIGAKNVIDFVDEPITGIRQFKAVDYYVPGLIAAFIMTNGIIGVTTNTTEFKRRGIIKRLSITPLAKIEWIFGNVLSQTLLNLMLTAVIIAVGWVVFGVQAIPDVIAVVLIFLGSIMFSGIGMILSGLVKDVEAASALGNAIAFPMMFLSGTYFPIDYMPSYLQSFSRVLPLTYFSETLRNVMIFNYIGGIFTDMLILMALAAAFIVVGALVTRWKER
jgi:ABC-2 type transport system permease protein